MNEMRHKAAAFINAYLPGAYAFPIKGERGIPSIEESGGSLFGKDVDVASAAERAWNQSLWEGATGYAVVPVGYTVLDFDSPEAAAQWREDHGSPPMTLTVKTPRADGGWHLYFKGETVQGTPAQNVDVRSGTSGYVYGPGSVSIKAKHEGRSYEIVSSVPPQELSDAWRSAIYAGKRERQEGLSEVMRSSEMIGEGVREDTLTTIAGHLINLGFQGQLLADTLVRINAERCVPPLDRDDIMRVADSAVKMDKDVGDFSTIATAHEILKSINQEVEDDELTESFAASIKREYEILKARNIAKDAIAKENAKPLDVSRLFNQDILTLPEPGWVLKDIWPDAQLTLLTGAAGAKKSFIMQNISMYRAMSKMLPEKDISVTVEGRDRYIKPASVLYCAGEGVNGYGLRAEAWRHSMANWLMEYQKCGVYEEDREWRDALELAASIFESIFTLYGAPFGLVNMHEELKRLIDTSMDEKPDLIIFDTLRRYSGGLDENSVSEIGQFIDIASALGIEEIVVVHHNNKEGNYRGSSALLGDFDTVLSVEPESDETFNTRMKVEKFKDAEPFPRPLIWEWESHKVRSSGATSLALKGLSWEEPEPGTPDDNAENANEVNTALLAERQLAADMLPSRIREVLGGSCTRREAAGLIRESFGGNITQALVAVDRLVEEEKLSSDGDHVYADF